MKYKIKNKILAITLLIAFAVSVFEPMARYKTIAETKEQQEVTEEEPQVELVELEEERTEDSTTYEGSDGKKTIRYYGKAVRFKDPKTKELIDYDPTLGKIKEKKTKQGTKLKEYRYENKAGDKKNYLPKILSKDTPVITEYKNYQMSLIPLDNTKEKEIEYTSISSTVEKEKVIDLYDEEEKAITGVSYLVEEDISYQYNSQKRGMKETIILNKRPETN